MKKLFLIFWILFPAYVNAALPIFDVSNSPNVKFINKPPKINNFSSKYLRPGELITITGKRFNVDLIKRQKIAIVDRVFANDPNNKSKVDSWSIIHKIKPKRVTKNKIVLRIPSTISPNKIWSFFIPNKGKFVYKGRKRNQAYWLASSLFLKDATFYVLNEKQLDPANDPSPNAILLKDWPDTTTNYVDSNGNPMVNICIHDSACEDGDVASVIVNFKEEIKSELVNAWSCKLVPVVKGVNRVAVFAVNGTGYKGSCDFSNANTGEIGISGLDSSGNPTSEIIQSWRVKGGAGTTSFINIIN